MDYRPNRVSLHELKSFVGTKSGESDWDGYYSDAYHSAHSSVTDDENDEDLSITVSDPQHIQLVSQEDFTDEDNRSSFLPDLNRTASPRFSKLWTRSSRMNSPVLQKVQAHEYWSQESLWRMMCLLVTQLNILIPLFDICLKWVFFACMSQLYLVSVFSRSLRIMFAIFCGVASIITILKNTLILSHHNSINICALSHHPTPQIRSLLAALLLNEAPLTIIIILLAMFGFSCSLQQTFLTDPFPRLFCISGLVIIFHRFISLINAELWKQNKRLKTLVVSLLWVIIFSLKIVLIIFAFSNYASWDPFIDDKLTLQLNYGTNHVYLLQKLNKCDPESEGDLTFCPVSNPERIFLGKNHSLDINDNKLLASYSELQIPCEVWRGDIVGNLQSFLPFIEGSKLEKDCRIKVVMNYDRINHIIKYNILLRVTTENNNTICSDILVGPVNVPWTVITLNQVVAHACSKDSQYRLPNIPKLKSILTEVHHFDTPVVRCSDWCLHTPNCQKCVLNSLTYSNRPAADGIYYFASKDLCTCPNEGACPLRQCQWTKNTMEGCYPYGNGTCGRPTHRQSECLLETDVSVSMDSLQADNKLGPMTLTCNGCGSLTTVRDPNLTVNCQ